ncbi:MAG: peptidylprolyl isomerase [Bacteroidetes bacterium B1(2017)]|nr:MAG: peptidylprolyl isomerase [Bacteroidetes bacterium B1(2017)]
MKKISLFILFVFSISILANAQTQKQAKPSKKNTPVHKQTVVSKPTEQKADGQRVEISTSYGVMVVRLYNETPLHRDNFIKLVKQGFYDSLLFHRVIKSFMIQGGDPVSKTADSNAMLGSGDVGYKIPAEINDKLYHKRGALAAARDNNPQKMSSGCQFYIVQGKTYTGKEMEAIINNRNLTNKQGILYSMYQTDTVQAALSALQNLGDQDRIRKFMDELAVVADKEYKKQYPNAETVNMNQVQTYMEFGGAPHLDGGYTVFGELEKGWEVLDKIAAAETRPGDRPVKDIRMKMRLIK